MIVPTPKPAPIRADEPGQPACHECKAVPPHFRPVLTAERRWVCGACQAAICPACGNPPRANDILCTPCRESVAPREQP